MTRALHRPATHQSDLVADMSALSLPSAHGSVNAALLPELIEMYFSAKRSERKPITPKTEQTYRIHIKPFLRYWSDCPDRHRRTISFSVLNDFYGYLTTEYRNDRNEPPAENTIAHCLIVLRQIFEWMYQNECTDGVPIQKWIPAQSLVQPDVYYPEPRDIQRLFDSIAQTTENRLRDTAIVAFTLSTGARASEVAFCLAENVTFVDTQLDDLHLSSSHRGYVYLEQVKGDMSGRKNKGRYVVFCSKAGLLLKCWIKHFAPDDRLFNFEHGHGIYLMIQRHIKRMKSPGDAENLSMQSLRRAFSDNWDEKLGIEGRTALKLQMGHSMRGDVTQDHYINPKNKRRIAKQLLELHVSPLAEIDIQWKRYPVINDASQSRIKQ